jgi:hypothetical protein
MIAAMSLISFIIGLKFRWIKGLFVRKYAAKIPVKRKKEYYETSHHWID